MMRVSGLVFTAVLGLAGAVPVSAGRDARTVAESAPKSGDSRQVFLGVAARYFGYSPEAISGYARRYGARDDLAGVPLPLFGVSRGAAAALIAAVDEDAVAAVVSDSAFSTPHTLHGYMRRWAPIFVDSRMLVLSAPDAIFSIFRWFATRLAEHRVGVRFTPLVPALKRLRKPVLFMHGERDNYISTDQAHLLYGSTAAEKQLWIAPNADHNRAVDADPDEYRRRIVRFLRSSLNVAEPAVTTAV